MTLGMLLMIVAIVCLFLASFGVGAGRVSLFPLGMAFWAVAVVFGGVGLTAG
jgi:hypothetical protein